MLTGLPADRAGMSDHDDDHPVVLGVAGAPDVVGNSLSPTMFAAAFAATGIRGYYVPLAIRERSAHKALRGLPRLGFRGVNVTMPFKHIAAEIAHSRSGQVEATGVANTLLIDPHGRIHAEATDSTAIGARIAAAGISLTGAEIAIVGAGGAALEAAWACAQGGAARITVWNRSRTRASELAQQVQGAFPDVGLEISTRLPIHVPAHVLISAVPEAAWRPQELHQLEGEKLVVDLAYRRDRQPTALIQAARSIGCPVVDGQEILVSQAAAAFRLWFELEPPTEVMTRAVR